MIQRTLIRIALASGVAWWLARVTFSRSKRRRLDAAMQAIDNVSFKSVDGLDYQRRIRTEWEHMDATGEAARQLTGTRPAIEGAPRPTHDPD